MDSPFAWYQEYFIPRSTLSAETNFIIHLKTLETCKTIKRSLPFCLFYFRALSGSSCWLRACLYERREGTFTGMGRLPGRDVYRDGTFTGMGRLPGRDVYREGTFTGKGRLPGWDVYRDGTFTGKGRLPGWDVYRDGTFTGTERLPGRDVYNRLAFIWTFCRRDNENLLVLDAMLNLLYLRVTYCKKRNVSKISCKARWSAIYMARIVQLKPGFRLLKPVSQLGETGRKTSRLYIIVCDKNYRNIYMSGSRASSCPGKRPVPHLI